MSIPVEEFIHAHPADAIRALARVGARHDPRLDMTTEIPGVGKVHRYYGIVGNVLELQRTVESMVVVERLLPLVRDSDNERIHKRLEEGKLEFTPANKRALRLMAPSLVDEGVHVPWSWRPMNFDLATKASAVHRQSPFGFIVFYSQHIKLEDGAVSPGRFFSLPIEGTAQGTWAEPISDDILDLDVAVLLEANALVPDSA